MMESEALQEFKRAVGFLRDGHPDQALVHMRRAAELEKNNPYYLSFLGLVLARAEQKWADAEQLCETAIRLKRNEPQFYLHLAEVYARAGRREDAAEIITRGMKNVGRNHRLHLALSKLTDRRQPIIPFLEQKNFLNRYLGKLRHRTLKSFAEA